MSNKISMVMEYPIIPHTAIHTSQIEIHPWWHSWTLPAALQCVNTLWSAKHMSSFGFFSSFAFSSSSLLSSSFLSLFNRFSSFFSFFRRSFSYSQDREKESLTPLQTIVLLCPTTTGCSMFTWNYQRKENKIKQCTTRSVNDHNETVRSDQVLPTSAFLRASTAFMSIMCCLRLSLSWQNTVTYSL